MQDSVTTKGMGAGDERRWRRKIRQSTIARHATGSDAPLTTMSRDSRPSSQALATEWEYMGRPGSGNAAVTMLPERDSTIYKRLPSGPPYAQFVV